MQRLELRGLARGALLWALLSFMVACGDAEQSGEPAKDAGYVDDMAEEHAGDSSIPSGAIELGEVAAMPVLSETVEYGRVNGVPVSGYLAYPETAHGGLPGVLMFPEWWGLNDNIRAMADKLAAQGYVVLALDIYGGEAAETPEAARELMQAAMADKAALNDNIREAWKFMTEEIGALSVASLGWCLGGTLAFNTALLYPDQLDAAVVYYGHVASVTPEQLAMLNMPILGFFGADDGGIPVAGVRQFEQTLESLGKDAEIVIYEGAGHAFANPTGENFRPEPAADAWQKTLTFLDRTLNAAVNRNVIDKESAPVPTPATTR
ncbi:MAG TPA: dienelactone hydrolase family protein [Gammaproteobacteria bacterium]